MELSRVQEIIQSDQNIDVKLNGNSIWIESLNESDQTVKIHFESDPKQTQVVDIKQIKE